MAEEKKKLQSWRSNKSSKRSFKNRHTVHHKANSVKVSPVRMKQKFDKRYYEESIKLGNRKKKMSLGERLNQTSGSQQRFLSNLQDFTDQINDHGRLINFPFEQQASAKRRESIATN